MNHFCSLRGKTRISVVHIVSYMLLLISGPVNAAVYDDFNAAGIDGNRWEIIGSGFFQPGDGYLHFSATTGKGHSLVSKELFTSGIFTMSFDDYKCNNDAPKDKGLGSIAGLALGIRSMNNWVRIERGQVKNGGYIEVNWVVPSESGHPIHVNCILSEITSGFLQIRYEDAQVSFFYRAQDTDEWTQMVKTDPRCRPALKAEPFILHPGWETDVPLFITAFPGGATSDKYFLRFKVDHIDIMLPVKAP
jgi:hypothetical protein